LGLGHFLLAVCAVEGGQGGLGEDLPGAAAVRCVDDVEDEEPFVVLGFALNPYGHPSVAGIGVVVVVPDAQHGCLRRGVGEIQVIGGVAVGVEGETDLRVVLVEVVELVEEGGALVGVYELVFELGVVGVSAILPEENMESVLLL
jgi:hypothetical protein